MIKPVAYLSLLLHIESKELKDKKDRTYTSTFLKNKLTRFEILTLREDNI